MPKIWLSSQLRALAPGVHDENVDGDSALDVITRVGSAAPAFRQALFPGGELAPFVAIFLGQKHLLPHELDRPIGPSDSGLRIIFGVAGG